MKECEYCYGTGIEYISCCGDDITGTINETDLCPTCLEHCGTDGEKCAECKGTGLESKTVYTKQTKHFTIKKSNTHLDGFIFTDRTSKKNKFMLNASIEYIETLK